MDSVKRHILFLARWYPNREDPMLGLFVRNHAVAVSQLNSVSALYVHAVAGAKKKFDVVTFDDESVKTCLVYYRTPQRNIPVITVLYKTFLFLRAHKYGLKKVKELSGPPDLCHVNVLTRHGVVALFLKWRFHIPYIITEHWSRYLPIRNSYSGNLRKFFTQLVVKNAGAVTTISENLMSAMKNQHLKNPNYQVIHNVVDTHLFQPDAAISSRSKIRMIHISCFEDQSKNISGLLRTLKKLSMVRNDWECVMVGDGMDFQQMKNLAEELEIDIEFLRFTGLLQGVDLVKEIQHSDFLIMFSNYENIPVVINEALACGKPVLATAVGGIPEVVSQDRGLLVDAGNEEALLSQMEIMLSTYSLYNNNHLRAFAVKMFSYESVGKKIDAIYQQVLRKN